MTTTELVTSIDRRIDEVRAEITKLQAARDQLVNGHRPAKPAARKPRANRAESNGSKLDVVPQGKLEKILADNPGSTTTGLAKLANADRDQVLTLLKELETAGRVRRSGERAGTRWHRFAEEDAIAERAVELASRRKKKAPKGPKPRPARVRPARRS